RRRRRARASPRRPGRCRRSARRRRRCRPPPRTPAGTARSSARAPLRRAPPERPRRRDGATSAERALQLVEEPLVVAVGLVAGTALELLEQPALLVVEV